MKVNAHAVETLTLASDTFTSDIEQFFTGQGIDITRNTFGELLYVDVDGVTYPVGKTYGKSPDGSISEYAPFVLPSPKMVCEEYLQREIPVEGSALKLTHAIKGGYTVTGFNTRYNPANIFCGMGVGSVEELNIQFQSGAIIDGQWNGITNEVLLAIVLDRLELLQSGKYPCDQNAEAIKGIQHALDSLLDRKSPGDIDSSIFAQPTNDGYLNGTNVIREVEIYKLKEIFDGWSKADPSKLNALEQTLSENKIQLGGLSANRSSLIFKYNHDPKGEWLTVIVDEICDDSKTKWSLSGNGYTIMVKYHPIFDHETVLNKVLK